MAARHQLHRVSNDFTTDQRRLHTFRAGSDGIVDGHRVDFDRCAASGPYTLHHALRQFPVVPVAWHGADPAVSDANLRPRQIFVAETDRLHHRARYRTIRPLQQRTALVSWINGHLRLPFPAGFPMLSTHEFSESIAHLVAISQTELTSGSIDMRQNAVLPHVKRIANTAAGVRDCCRGDTSPL